MTSGFRADDYQFTATLLRSSREGIVRSTLSNNINIILSALDKMSAPKSGRPDWTAIYRDSAHTPDRDDELIVVTREALRLALSALQKQNGEDYYHNYGAAASEIDLSLSSS